MVLSTILGFVKIAYGILSIPVGIIARIANVLLLITTSVVLFPLFLLINLLQKLEANRHVEGDMRLPWKQMTLAGLKLVITISNFSTYMVPPTLPILYLTSSPTIPPPLLPLQTWLLSPLILTERKAIFCLTTYIILTFVQFHTLRFLFSRRLPGLILRR